MKTEFRTITPRMAEDLLQRNNMNRLIRKAVVQNYTRQMNDDLWLENTGEPILIASDGIILDGQHRLHAIINSGKSFKFLVVEGLNKEIFSVIDTGAKRTPGDALHINGVSNANAIAKGIRTYLNYKLGRVAAKSTAFIPNLSIIKLYDKKPKYWDGCYDMAAGWYRKSHLLSVGEYVGLFAYFDEFDNSDSYNFISKFAEGANLSRGNPIFVLREKLSFARQNGKISLNPSVKTAYIFKAWNAYRDGKSLSILRYNPTDERFPVAK